MHRLQFRTHPDGLLVDLFVGVSAPLAANLIRAGVPVPRPVVVRGLLDTGADRTCVPADVIAALGLQQPVAVGRNQTASAVVKVRLFELAVGFPASVTGGPPVFWHDALHVVEMTTRIPGFDMLIGLDLLLTCRFTLDGPAGAFALDF